MIQMIETILTRRLFAAFVALSAGSLAALSMAPLNIWGTLFISLPALYLSVLYARSCRAAMLLGWLFGFGYFLFSLSWIGNALLVEGNPYQWAWILAVSGLPALLAFFPAIAMGLSKRFLDLRSLAGWLGFVSFYCGFEWLRGHVFTGFPWNLMGYTWTDNLAMLQVLRLSDVYMLTWLTALWASAPASIVLLNKCGKIKVSVIVCASFLACGLFGAWTLRDGPTYRDDVSVRLVQPNIGQAEKWRGDKMAAHFRKALALSKNTEGTDTPTIIVWPETAISYRLWDSPDAAADMRTMLASYPPSSVLLTGMLRFDRKDASYANSLVMIGQDGAVENIYEKHHLVPFGEYIPFQKWIPLAPIVQFKGFTRGSGLQTMATPSGLKYSPLVCYEILFPGRSIQPHSSPDFIVNVTNDGWYGESAGPYQHLVQAQFRAIETGIPVIRSANTGISAIFSPQGYITGKINLSSENAQTLALPDRRNIPDLFFPLKRYSPILFIMFFAFTGVWFNRHFTNAD